MRLLVRTVPLCAALALSALAPSCAPAQSLAPVAASSPLREPTVHQVAAEAVRAASAPSLGSSSQPPLPAVTTPMQGEPTAAALGEVRLSSSSCEDPAGYRQTLIKARIKEMREAVDQQFKQWAEGQPACWAEYRALACMNGGPGCPESTYGFGMSGVGEGSGSGYGIGLGSIGTIGHAGGSGAGRPDLAASSSSTNNQVAGVDEADIVKTDGRYVYFALNGALRIVEALKPRTASVTRLPGDVREMFVEGDRAVIYTASKKQRQPCTYGYDCMFAGDGSSTTIVVLDIADRAHPKIVRQIELTGSLMAARRIGTAVHTVVADGDSPEPVYSTWPDDLEMCGTRESSVRAKFAALKAQNEREIRESTRFPTIRDRNAEQALCQGLLRPAVDDGGAFTTLASFDLTNDRVPLTTATIQSRPGAVFASSDAVYVSVVHQRAQGRHRPKPSAPLRWYSFYPNVDEVSEVHKFQIGAQPQATRYVGSGVVPGHVLNQFAMDEWQGYLRIATTRGRVPSPGVSSAVSILAQGEGGNLVRVGAVEEIAQGEDIRAVRFDGDRGYVVTFKKTDPLFVIDLYDPKQPAILGELKIPGFSTYLHRIDPDHLLSIGFDANDHGDFAYFDGVILQLFDVHNPTAPMLLHKEKIGTRGSTSAAATNHLAFNYFGERGLLAIPMTICEGGGDGVAGRELTFSGLLVYDVSVERGFRRLGGINHGPPGATCSAWWSKANSVVQRSIFLDDLVYSIALDRAKVQRIGHFGEDVADIRLTL
jgi:hypothetical protein